MLSFLFWIVMTPILMIFVGGISLWLLKTLVSAISAKIFGRSKGFT